MLRESGCFVFRLAILDLFACLCLVSGAEGMAGQGGGLALIPWLLGGLSHGRKKRGGLALIPCLLAFLRLGTVGKCDMGRKIYRAFWRFCD